MAHEFFWPVFGVLFFFGLIALAMIRNHLSASRKIQLRAIQKEERMKAIEAGVPLPEIEEPIRGVMGGSPDPEQSFAYQLQWLRIVALALGCFMVFAGIGMFLAFEIVDDSGLRSLSAMGFLPALAGVGLLLFYWVSRQRS